jgi:cell division protein ZapA
MSRYTLSIKDLEVSFRTDAEESRVLAAKALVEEQYDKLDTNGLNLSREKLLTVLALSVADDYLQIRKRLEDLEGRIENLAGKMS